MIDWNLVIHVFTGCALYQIVFEIIDGINLRLNKKYRKETMLQHLQKIKELLQ